MTTPRAADRLVPYVSGALLLAALANVLLATIEVAHRHTVARQRAHPASAALVRQVAASDGDVHRVAIAAGLLALTAVVLWLLWFTRVAANAADFRPVRYPGWSVAGWLLPVLSFYRPKQMVNDVWAAGDADNDTLRLPRGIPALYQVWWASVVAAWLLARWAVVGSLLRAVTFALAVPVAVRLTRRLSARYSARVAPPSTGTTQPVT